MVRRTLYGEIQGDLEVVATRAGEQVLELLQGAELRMDGGMAAMLRADRIRASRIPRAGLQGIVFAFSMRQPDGMDGRKIQHIEAHVPNRGQPRDHIAKAPI